MEIYSDSIFKKVLCLSPHPDDIEYSISGIIKKNSNVKFDIYSMSTGNEFEKLKGEFRHDEIENFWSEYDCDNVRLINSNILYVNKLSEDAWVAKIEKELNKSDYNCILVPSFEDNHLEHRLVNQIGFVLSRNLPINLIEYQTPSTRYDWVPNMFVDISNYFDFKSDCIERCFKKQIESGRNYFLRESLLLFCSDYLSTRKGIKYVEKFKIRLLIEK